MSKVGIVCGIQSNIILVPFLYAHISSRTSNPSTFESNSKFGSFANFAAFAARRRSLPHYSGLNSILPGLQTIPVAWWEPLSHSRPPSSIFSLFLVRVFHCARCAHSHNVFRSFSLLHVSASLEPPPFVFPRIVIPLRVRRHPGRSKNTYIFPSKSKISLTFPSPFILGLRRVPNNYPWFPQT